ncbi:MAG: SatD family protein, partial [Clostridia bacterium]|nr:SatD family protein [Clostridia bacterium]
MYCVIMGDIVHSKLLFVESKGLAAKQIKEILDDINVKYANYILAEFGLVRGDAFEGVLYTQRFAPQIILEIIKSVYKINGTIMRFSAVMDTLTVVSSDRNMANGPAFHEALEQVDTLKKKKSNHWLQVSFVTDTIAQEMVESIIGLLTALTKKWTDQQREISWAMDEYGQQALVSKRLGIAPSIVSRQLKAANYSEYSLAWKSLEAYLEKAEEASIPKEVDKEPGYTVYYSVAKRKFEQRDYA